MSVRTDFYFSSPCFTYMTLCACVFVGVLYLMLVNSSNELMFAIYSIRHNIKRIARLALGLKCV